MNRIREELDFLSTYLVSSAPAGSSVTIRETHMSLVLICDQRVLKFKKPVRMPFVDFTSVRARENNCREEVRLNRRLAPDVYKRVIPLRRLDDGQLGFGGRGEIIDWLVEMRRLPEECLMDVMLREKRLTPRHIQRLTDRLTEFYRSAPSPRLDEDQHFRALEHQQDLNRQVLEHADYGFDRSAARHALDRIDTHLAAFRPAILQRIVEGRFVEGHGDLRPEHVCFTEPLVIFDCLEFDPTLRMLDPFDEIAFLGMECSFLGASNIAATMFRQLTARLEGPASPQLFAFYGAFRATMRARMALSHLLDGSTKEASPWIDKTDRYIRLALERLEQTGPGQSAQSPEGSPRNCDQKS